MRLSLTLDPASVDLQKTAQGMMIAAGERAGQVATDAELKDRIEYYFTEALRILGDPVTIITQDVRTGVLEVFLPSFTTDGMQKYYRLRGITAMNGKKVFSDAVIRSGFRGDPYDIAKEAASPLAA